MGVGSWIPYFLKHLGFPHTGTDPAKHPQIKYKLYLPGPQTRSKESPDGCQNACKISLKTVHMVPINHGLKLATHKTPKIYNSCIWPGETPQEKNAFEATPMPNSSVLGPAWQHEENTANPACTSSNWRSEQKLGILVRRRGIHRIPH